LTTEHLYIATQPTSGINTVDIGSKVWRLPWSTAASDLDLADPQHLLRVGDQSQFGTQLAAAQDAIIISDPSVGFQIGMIYSWDSSAELSTGLEEQLDTIHQTAFLLDGGDLDVNLGQRLVADGDVVVVAGDGNGDDRAPTVYVRVMQVNPDTTYGWHDGNTVSQSTMGFGRALALWEHRLIVAMPGALREYYPQPSCCDLNEVEIYSWSALTLTELDELELLIEPGLLLAFLPSTQTLHRWRTITNQGEWLIDEPLDLDQVVTVALANGYLATLSATAELANWRTDTWMVVHTQDVSNSLTTLPREVRLLAVANGTAFRVAWLVDDDGSNGQTQGSVLWLELELPSIDVALEEVSMAWPRVWMRHDMLLVLMLLLFIIY
jgi:hypothetical protein